MKKLRKRYNPAGFALRVGKSKTGRGLFALEEIPAGACIVEYIGRPVPEAEQYTSRSKYLFETGRTTAIDGNIKENIARYINHSCAPNCEAETKNHRIYVFALRTIKAGEELNYDYGEEYFNEYFKAGGCRCDSCAA